ncbi:MAG TPA: hypothetical protein VN654_16285 [Vicinamibacterales bacterium]|jgi:hypothetical protein|nr:hypothetical protein [Vicinamibacterales bacterium]
MIGGASKVLFFLNVVGLIEAAVLVILIIAAIVLWTRGIAPVLWRLGNGLAHRKIAVFAKGDTLSSLRSLLVDSKLFRAKNICEVTYAGDIGRADGASVYLVFWPDWSEHIDAILASKSDASPLIVYQPYDRGRLSDSAMAKLDGTRNTAVTNFRGRLLNDVVTSIITTSYEK